LHADDTGNNIVDNTENIENQFPESIQVKIYNSETAGFRFSDWDGVLD